MLNCPKCDQLISSKAIACPRCGTVSSPQISPNLTSKPQSKQLAMLNCPKCDQLISSKAIACPRCGTVLKAYGHPGITLHRATDNASLCDSCTYHADDTCNFPQRPHAQECTLYHDLSQPLVPNTAYNQPSGLVPGIRLWCQQNPGLLGLMILSLVSLVLALIATSK